MRIFDNVTESSTVSFDVPVFEGYDAETGDLRAISEAAQDMVGVYEAMHGYAMAELGVEQGTVTMEAAGEKGRNVFQRILDSLKKLWGKIRNFFQNVIAAFNAKVKSGKDFAKKYKDKVTGNLVAAEVYNYSGLSKNPIDGLFDKASKFVSSNQAKLDSDGNIYKDQLTEEFRGELVGSGRCSEEQFREKAIAYMRGGETKTELQLIASNVFKILENTEAVQEANKAKTEMDKSFKNIIDSIQADQKRYETSASKMNKEEQANEYRQANTAITIAKNKQALFTSTQSICTMYFNVWKSVWTEREKAYKSIVVKTLKSK